jgi:hypothetical protein
MGLGAGVQLPHCFGINAGIPHVQFQIQVVLQGVGAFHHDVEGLDAVYGDVAFGENLGPCVVEVYTDKNAELIGQDDHAFLAWLRRCSQGGRYVAAKGRASAASFRLGNECDMRNIRFRLCRSSRQSSIR